MRKILLVLVALFTGSGAGAQCTGIITTIAGNGTARYSGDGGAATSASLSHPDGVAVDGSGNLYISDYGNNRIRKVASLLVVSAMIGADSVCAGVTTTYSSATSGGAWASSNAAIALVCYVYAEWYLIYYRHYYYL